VPIAVLQKTPPDLGLPFAYVADTTLRRHCLLRLDFPPSSSLFMDCLGPGLHVALRTKLVHRLRASMLFRCSEPWLPHGVMQWAVRMLAVGRS